MNRATFLQRAGVLEHQAPRFSPQTFPYGREHWKSTLQNVRRIKARPCVHIAMDSPSTMHVCQCGLVYPCAKHKWCVVSGQQSEYRSCLYCTDYVEKIAGQVQPTIVDLPIAVTTSPLMRDGKIAGYRDTLEKTLRSIIAAGWDHRDVTIFAEPESVVPSGWNVVWREKVMGPWLNLYTAMRQQRVDSPLATGYLFLEDDTWLARDTRSELTRRGMPDGQWGLTRLFRMSGRGHPWRDSDRFCEAKRSDGYQLVIDGQYLWGTNAVVLSPTAVDRMLADQIDSSYADSPDIKLGKLMIQYGLREWCCNPSLAQTDHTQPSAIGHGVSKKMESDTFIEDALQVQSLYLNSDSARGAA